MHNTDEQKDPQLLALFATASAAPPNPDFAAQVLLAIRRRETLRRVLAGCLGLTVVLVAWGMGLFSWTIFVSLTGTELFNLGDSSLGVILGPLNTVLAMSVVVTLGLLLLWRKIRTASYGDDYL